MRTDRSIPVALRDVQLLVFPETESFTCLMLEFTGPEINGHKIDSVRHLPALEFYTMVLRQYVYIPEAFDHKNPNLPLTDAELYTTRIIALELVAILAEEGFTVEDFK